MEKIELYVSKITNNVMEKVNIVLAGITIVLLLLLRFVTPAIDFDGMDSLSSLKLISIVVSTLYWFCIVLLIVSITVGGAGIYQYVKKKEKTKLILGASSLLLTLGGSMLFPLVRLIKIAMKVANMFAKGDFTAVFKYEKEFEKLQNLNDPTWKIYFMIFLCIIVLGISIVVMMYESNKITHPLLDQLLDAKEVETTAVITKERKPMDFTKVKEFIKSKTAKVILVSIIVVVVAFSGFKIWDTYFNFKQIDIITGIDVEFLGVNGEGTAHPNGDDIVYDYDLNNHDKVTFFNNISYEVEQNEDLNNGDEIVVKAVYSQETAKKLKLKVTNDQMSFTVEGLLEFVHDVKDVEAQKEMIIDAFDDSVSEKKATFSDTKYTHELDSIYFVDSPLISRYYSSDEQQNAVVAIYKIDYTIDEDSWSFNKKDASKNSGTYYSYIYFTNYVKSDTKEILVSSDNLTTETLDTTDSWGTINRIQTSNFSYSIYMNDSRKTKEDVLKEVEKAIKGTYQEVK